ncbi:TetR/AcrR family transcriptional regulator [Tsukamurella sp. 1534]|uniref:TetR/AcrR family transcriptional regulator n=1 Tax=Tsukamurella sp. 1534 TaxID=1151061 RepID=UPI0002E40B37|nr:TetR/AcrR family transcriptional regulator [Tsukamurella sp. 1534]
MTSSAPRRGRPALGESRLSRAAVVSAALDLVDEQGVGEIGMRAVAKRLHVDPKSLYNHVRDKDDLLDAVTESLLRSIDLPRPTGDTAADVSAVAHAFRAAALRHPRAAPLVLTRQIDGAAALAPTEAMARILLDAGLPADEAVHTLRTLLAALIGTLLREVDAGPTFGTSDGEAIAHREEALAASGHPAVAEVAARLATFDADAEFHFTVAAMSDVVLARVAAARRR